MKKNQRELDFSKLKFSDKEMTTEEALKDVNPFLISEDVLNGKTKLAGKTVKKKGEKGLVIEFVEEPC